MKLNYDINIINSEIQKINLKTISKEWSNPLIIGL